MSPTAGLGFKPEHFEEAAASSAAGLWFEVHAENYMVDGGPRLAMLEALREKRPLSLHGVGLSLGGAERVNHDHLMRLKQLVRRFEPFLVSEHLAWSRAGDICLPDLLPIARTREALDCVVRNIDETQTALGRRILLENPSHYIPFAEHEWSEPDFLSQIARRTGCRLLIDVNNVLVSANNLDFCAYAYLDALPLDVIGEIHIAGHRPDPALGASLLIDSHDRPVDDKVWSLLDHLLARGAAAPVLLERDGDIPAFAELMRERDRAATALETSSWGFADAV